MKGTRGATSDAMRRLIGSGTLSPKQVRLNVFSLLGLDSVQANAGVNKIIAQREAGDSLRTVREAVAEFADKAREAREERIARFENLNAAQIAQEDAVKQHVDVRALNNVVKVWVIVPDNSTCPICNRLNGQRQQEGDSFEDPRTGLTYSGPPAHQNCRCGLRYFEARKDPRATGVFVVDIRVPDDDGPVTVAREDLEARIFGGKHDQKTHGRKGRRGDKLIRKGGGGGIAPNDRDRLESDAAKGIPGAQQELEADAREKLTAIDGSIERLNKNGVEVRLGTTGENRNNPEDLDMDPSSVRGRHNINAVDTATSSMESAVVLTEGNRPDKIEMEFAEMSERGAPGPYAAAREFGGTQTRAEAGPFKSGDQRITVNTNQEAWQSTTELSISKKLDAGSGFTEIASSESVLVHEIGHTAHTAGMSKGEEGFIRDSSFKREKAKVTGVNVSRYARSSSMEFVAEVYTGKTYGKVYGQEVEDLYKELKGPLVKPNVPIRKRKS